MKNIDQQFIITGILNRGYILIFFSFFDHSSILGDWVKILRTFKKGLRNVGHHDTHDNNNHHDDNYNSSNEGN